MLMKTYVVLACTKEQCRPARTAMHEMVHATTNSTRGLRPSMKLRRHPESRYALPFHHCGICHDRSGASTLFGTTETSRCCERGRFVQADGAHLCTLPSTRLLYPQECMACLAIQLKRDKSSKPRYQIHGVNPVRMIPPCVGLILGKLTFLSHSMRRRLTSRR